jgi:hypothetical protein
MNVTDRELWGAIHGMGFGALYLLAFAGGFAGFWSLRPGLLTPAGIVERIRRLKIGVVAMAAVAWGTVLTDTWIVFPWHRDPGPGSPRSTLLASEARGPGGPLDARRGVLLTG